MGSPVDELCLVCHERDYGKVKWLKCLKCKLGGHSTCTRMTGLKSNASEVNWVCDPCALVINSEVHLREEINVMKSDIIEIKNMLKDIRLPENLQNSVMAALPALTDGVTLAVEEALRECPEFTTSSLFTAVSKVFIAPLRCPLRESTYQHLPPRHFSPLLVKFSERMDWQLQLFADWDDQERLDAEINALVGARRRPRRIVTDRMNPFTSMSDDEFVDRFRLRKVSAVTLLEEVRNELPAAADLRGCPVPPHLQLLIAIRCMATGSHQVQGHRNMAGRLKRQNIIRENF
ncbi:hypothetical protein Pcinc_014780 [Petrolisthes cinctipes]|uniref:Zinc finger PHD-type domain-containing protein n=2 Tax=Petrolisthes cinctipes TaxID=88211 RepID=A0AAE1FVQ5_PETCI|nr:hypothetical protein Pcinc_014780 [Petrolisthes cinctipes]